MSESEQVTVCPYNKAHVVLNFRFNNHLIKCRKSYTGDELETCPFNSSHKIPKPEFYYHKKSCVDRNNILNYLQRDDTEKPKEKKKLRTWEDDENVETKDVKSKILLDLSEKTEFKFKDSNDNDVSLEELVSKRKGDKGERHGFENDDDKTDTDTKSYNKFTQLLGSIRSIANAEQESSVPENSKKIVKDWSDDEDDVPLNINIQNNKRSYRESSIESFKSNSSKYSQNNGNKFSQKSMNYKSYSRAEDSRQFRGTSRQRDERSSNSYNFNKQLNFQSSGSNRASTSHDYDLATNKQASNGHNSDQEWQTDRTVHDYSQSSQNLENSQNPKVTDWSDDEDDVPQTFKLSAKASMPEVQKLRGWSDDEDDISCNVPNTSSYDTRRWNDSNSEADFANNNYVTKSKRSRLSDRPSNEDILERFAKMSKYKDFMSNDTWFDKKYRKLDGGMDLISW